MSSGAASQLVRMPGSGVNERGELQSEAQRSQESTAPREQAEAAKRKRGKLKKTRSPKERVPRAHPAPAPASEDAPLAAETATDALMSAEGATEATSAAASFPSPADVPESALVPHGAPTTSGGEASVAGSPLLLDPVVAGLGRSPDFYGDPHWAWGIPVQVPPSPSLRLEHVPLAEVRETDVAAYVETQKTHWQSCPRGLHCPPDPAYPPALPAEAMLEWCAQGLRADAYLRRRIEETREAAFLAILRVRHVCLPVHTDMYAFTVPLNGFGAAECVAVLQTALQEAGYEFFNLAPEWYAHPEVNTVPEHVVRQEVQEVLAAIRPVVERWRTIAGDVPCMLQAVEQPFLHAEDVEDVIMENVDFEGDIMMLEGAPEHLTPELHLRVRSVSVPLQGSSSSGSGVAVPYKRQQRMAFVPGSELSLPVGYGSNASSESLNQSAGSGNHEMSEEGGTVGSFPAGMIPGPAVMMAQGAPQMILPQTAVQGLWMTEQHLEPTFKPAALPMLPQTPSPRGAVTPPRESPRSSPAMEGVPEANLAIDPLRSAAVQQMLAAMQQTHLEELQKQQQAWSEQQRRLQAERAAENQQFQQLLQESVQKERQAKAEALEEFKRQVGLQYEEDQKQLTATRAVEAADFQDQLQKLQQQQQQQYAQQMTQVQEQMNRLLADQQQQQARDQQKRALEKQKEDRERNALQQQVLQLQQALQQARVSSPATSRTPQGSTPLTVLNQSAAVSTAASTATATLATTAPAAPAATSAAPFQPLRAAAPAFRLPVPSFTSSRSRSALPLQFGPPRSAAIPSASFATGHAPVASGYAPPASGSVPFGYSGRGSSSTPPGGSGGARGFGGWPGSSGGGRRPDSGNGGSSGFPGGIPPSGGGPPQGFPLQVASAAATVAPVAGFRMMMPYNSIPCFDGTGTLEERRKWWTQFSYSADACMWTPEEKAKQLPRWLEGSSRAWHQQLDSATQTSWKKVSKAFVEQFCKSSDTVLERYMDMTPRRNEKPLHFLWRLNAAAAKAKVDTTSPETRQKHIRRFLQRVNDKTVRYNLAGRAFFSMKEFDRR